jgi:sugar transferase (PEP-CTERM/EpsH1 system associated)
VHSLAIGGLERVAVALAKGFTAQGDTVRICCLSGRGELANVAEDAGVGVISLGKGSGNEYRLPLRIARIIRKERFKVVHTHNEAGLIYGVPGAMLAGGCVIVHTEHGKEMDYDSKKIMHAAERVLLKKVDYAVAVSEVLRDRVCKTLRIEKARVLVIPNGIDVERFYHPEKRFEKRKTLGIELGSFVIGNVARLVPLKNHKFLIDVFKEVRKEFANARLCVIGGGPVLGDLRNYASRLGLADKAMFLGERIDVPELLSAFDLFVLPSLTEGISMTLLEAMAAGIPVMASDVGGNPEIVENDCTGFLMPVNDTKAWVEGIKRVIVDGGQKEAFSAAGRSRVRVKFSLAAMLENYRTLYSGKAL